ncbi:hypothetical protein [Croceitalea rosinachiae]|uniref:DUF1772 domain-containing protein n=1 Tax=Croceitalea rosinachiae TaxID=3075596 RepID=A0ABU3ABL2_9FLAO|nr:hypothetical protein [Croceitalea sp. F388]MDT0606316.1 hypothetical protein [Croceitalea sp. F388]
MSISIIRLGIDFGLVVLIWMIQLIVYPSFLHYTTTNLAGWHRKYTPLIGYIVGPLMLGQLGIAIYQVSTDFTFYHSLSILIIAAIWIITFLQFVPIHNNISKGRVSESMLMSLVRKNWSRTILWTLIFLSSAVQFF